MLACEAGSERLRHGTELDTAAGEGLPDGPPAAQVDVIVVGSGLSGLAATWEAMDAGADVLVLEMDTEAGGASRYAGNYFAVGTRWQADNGVADWPTQAKEQWGAITGGDGDDPTVSAFLEESASTLYWLESELGADILGPMMAPGESVARLHSVGFPGSTLASQVEDRLGDRLWLQHRADALVVDGGRVRGVVTTNLATGETVWVEADSVVVATGGFARQLERVAQDRPGLASLAPDHYAGAAGAGLELVSRYPFQNQGNYGVQLHGIADWREGFEGELLWVGVSGALLVDAEGERLGNEELAEGFYLSHVLQERGGRVFALWPKPAAATTMLRVPAYNWATAGVSETFPFPRAVDEGAMFEVDDLTEFARTLGMNPGTLTATVERYNALVRSGEDGDHGKTSEALESIDARDCYAAELVPGASKAFTGLHTTPDGEVLDADGDVVPGLYAAGEAAGVLGTEAVGWGFHGSATGVVWTGRNAGAAAAATAAR